MKKVLLLLVIIGGISSAFISKKDAISPEKQNATVNKASSEIEFQAITVDQAKALAKESGKLIFIDAYTVWCGPCKRMAATTFKDKAVADYFNENFINLKVEMEKDADGPNLARQYRVVAYPTLLFIDGDGKLVKSALGLQDASSLLTIAKSL